MSVDADGSDSRRLLGEILTEAIYQARSSRDWSGFGRLVEKIEGGSLMITVVVRTPEEVLKEAGK